MSKQQTKLHNIEQRLGYTFGNSELLRIALTHSSAGAVNNERLEFLGDALVDLIVGGALYHRFPTAKEGQLSRMRAHLVSGEALAAVAKELHLFDYVHLGHGEQRTGGRMRTSILAGVVEALVGAIYLDSNFVDCQSCVQNWFHARFADLVLNEDVNDAKSALQECMQAKKIPLPRYVVVSQEGKAHQQLFVVHCYIDVFQEPTEGKGRNRRTAEQQAAALMLANYKREYSDAT